MNDKTSKIKFVILIVAFGLLLLIPIGVFARYATAEPRAQATPPVEAAYPGPKASAVLPSPASSAFVPWFMQALRTNQEALKNKNLGNVMQHSLETKVAMYGSMATQWAIYKKATPIPPTYEIQHFPTPTFPVGLQEGGTSDFHTWEAIIHNGWAQFVNNDYVIIYAGELGYGTDYPGRGMVYVLRETSQGEEVIETSTCCQRELVGCAYPKSRGTISS
jgi:hypothetical protein